MSYFSFQKPQRIRRALDFEMVYKKGRRKSSGPLLVYSAKNNKTFTRLGLSVPKRVGNAVFRNQIKRRCREAFRLNANDLPTGLDIVLNIRSHELLSVEEYASLINRGLD